MAENFLNVADIPTIVSFAMMQAAGASGGAGHGGAAAGGKGQKSDDNKRQAAEVVETKQEVKRVAPIIKHPDDAAFGDLELVQSRFKTNRVWTAFEDLEPKLIGQKVLIRGRLHNSRCKASVGFLVIRRGFNTVQAVLAVGAHGVNAEFMQYAAKIPCESIVDIVGHVVKGDVKSCSQNQVEVQVERLQVVHASAPQLPFQLEDAARPEPKEGEVKEVKEVKKSKGKAEKEVITVSTDVRLDNRYLDLRTPANHAIFRLQSRVCQFYRAFFTEQGFVEIHTPKITPGVSEGGADVFKLDYFGQPACLAQSPQLYKQMGVTSDLFKVFEIGHVFRAENSNTHRHMTEFIGLDFEMEIKEHYHELLQTLGNCFVYIFDMINKHCQPELAAVAKQYGYEPLKYSKETLVLSFKEAQNMLRATGEQIADEDDLSTPQEKKLGKLVREKYNTDFYIVDQYPVSVRPFYTMPSAENKGYTNSYDVFLRGEEITSGAQRIHDVDMLTESAIRKKIDPKTLKSYLDSFRYGAWPHGGAGIGLERVVMLFLGLDNIRKTSMFPRTPNRLTP